MMRLLFLSGSHRCSGLMAEGFLRKRLAEGASPLNRENIEIATISRNPGGPEPRSIEVMAEAGVEIADLEVQDIALSLHQEYDVLIALCGQGGSSCPMLPGQPERVEWNLPEPHEEEVTLDWLRARRDQVQGLVGDLLDRGYLAALVEAKRRMDLIMNHLGEGLIAMDRRRHILYFNRAAEQLTEYDRLEVLGRDCREVFPGGLCGGDGALCARDLDETTSLTRRSLEICTKSGERRHVLCTTRPLLDGAGQLVGALNLLHDQTREWEMARRLGEMEELGGLIGRDPAMLQIFDLIREVADSNASVLIQGESGTGKELVAAAIHRESGRAAESFVAVHCGALPDSLLESELFGHVKGAFTGAIRDKKGRFERAHKGTLFLDEIGDISPLTQVKLLRVIQEGVVERVGAEEPVQVDVRIVCATNRNLKTEVEKGNFRQDLYYRLAVVPLELPPLRKRKNDIPILAERLLERLSGDNPPRISPDALDLLLEYHWPGNVRELQNWLQFALVKAKGEDLERRHFPPEAQGHFQGEQKPPSTPRRRKKLNTETVRDALKRADNNRVQAARYLGVGRATLYRFLKAHPELDKEFLGN